VSQKPSLFRCGYVTIIGRPNAGKSTLLNRLLGEKVAIVTDKPQTTRTIVQGAVTGADFQIVFFDTPGIYESSSRIHQRMMQSARAALEDRDLVIYVLDGTRPFHELDEKALRFLQEAKTPALLVVNKVDAVRDRKQVLELLQKYQSLHPFEEYLPISAASGEGVDELQKQIVKRLPEGPAVFPEDYLTDQPERFLAAEFVREQVLLATSEEVPHSVTVWVDEFVDKAKVTYINATILVEREGQKKIVIGKGGAMLKRIGTEARSSMERLLDRKVFLELFVKVRENWRDKQEYLNTLDWRTQIGMPVAGLKDLESNEQ
jgi:GTPase